MNKLAVKDISRKDVHDTNYDLALFCAGYEPRCTFLSEVLGETKIKSTIIFSYIEHGDMPHRASIDSYFKKAWPTCSVKLSSASSVQVIFKSLTDWFSKNSSEKPIRILVDYSSMTKAWLSSIIFFFFKYLNPETKVTVDFSYSMGEYPKLEEQTHISDPLVIRGCEGSPLTKSKRASIFLLGFDALGPLALCNSISPDISYGIYASPSTKDSYVNRVLSVNDDFINVNLGGAHKLLPLPLASVHTAYKFINQMIFPLKPDYNVCIGLYGPKPHVLAAMLTSMSSTNVTCMYSNTVNAEPRLVQGIGELVLTRVSLITAVDDDGESADI